MYAMLYIAYLRPSVTPLSIKALCQAPTVAATTRQATQEYHCARRSTRVGDFFPHRVETRLAWHVRTVLISHTQRADI